MGLSQKELTQISETLAAGKRPRVVFTESAGQIAGQIGHVVKLEDPAVEDDWILVKFGADILPFPPADLSVAPRGATAKRAPEPAPPPAPSKPEPEFKVVREQVPAARQEKTVPAKPDAKTDAKPEQPPQESAAPAPRRPATPKGPKVKALPSFTITLSYTEGEWLVGAVQGSKTLAKPYVIKPAEALKMVALMDVPGVHEAVEQIMTAERAQAQAHAEKLRAELAELEAKLAELGA